MTINGRETYVLAKMEATYGTDAAPAAVNSLLVKNVQGEPFEAEAIDRGLVKPFLGASPKTHVAVHRKLSFEVEIAGAGAAGTAPGYDPLLRSCGLAAVVTAGTQVEYTPISSGFESATQYFYKASELRKLQGCRGTVGLNFTEKQLPHFKFDFTGLWSPPLINPPPTPDFSIFEPPLVVSFANTDFSIWGHAAPLKSLEINLGGQVVFKDRPNQQGVQITDRQVGGSIEFEWPALTDWDIEADALDNKTGVLALAQGTAAGNIVGFDAPSVQILNPKFTDDDGTLMCRADLLFVPVVGNDEFKLTVK